MKLYYKLSVLALVVLTATSCGGGDKTKELENLKRNVQNWMQKSKHSKLN